METICMTIQEIATRLVELCRKGDFETAQKELFAHNAVSIEQQASTDFEKETHGLEAILSKGDKFKSMVQEMHQLEVSEPLVAAHSFTMLMTMDATMKKGGRMKMPELCLYLVKDGKIVSESFFM